MLFSITLSNSFTASRLHNSLPVVRYLTLTLTQPVGNLIAARFLVEVAGVDPRKVIQVYASG